MTALEDYIGRRVKVKFLTGSHWLEGQVIGYHSEPTLMIRTDDGALQAVSSNLPIEVIERRRTEVDDG